MATKTKPKRMTAEQFLVWSNRPENENGNYELFRGEIVEVPPPQHPHGVYCWLVARLLTQYLTKRDDGYLCTNDTGIIVERKPDTVRGADLMLFLEIPADGVITPGYVTTVPNLIVEVLSPEDRPGKTNIRIDQYIRRGVPLVWLIDPEERVVTVYRPEEFPKVLDESDELSGNGVLPGFSCKVSELFTLPKKTARRPRKGNRE